jgi:uncharacterized RDD family membrane protein YckC
MTYESVLLFGVVFVASYALLSLAHWTYPLVGYQRLVLQIVLFLTVGLYFTYQWSRTGQTLAMKSWHMRVVDATGKPPRTSVAAIRYILAWHLLLPWAAWHVLFGLHEPADLLVPGIGFVLLLLLPALLDPRRRLLHDWLTATRMVREQ